MLILCYHRVHTTEAYRELILHEAKSKGGVSVGHIILRSWFVLSCCCKIQSRQATVAKVHIT